MDAIIANYTSLETGLVTAVQKLGLLTIPIVIVIAVIINYFGGERALRAVGYTIAVVAILNLVLQNATGLGTWLNAPTAIAAGH